jgi:glycine/D-amino acid oxidase-like deaminating enzyme
MSEKTTFSYWEKTSFLEPRDLIIIGAGIVGMSAGLFYKRANPKAQVLILDKGFMPEGASTRNAGFACIGSVGEHVSDMEKEAAEKIRIRIAMRYRGLQLLRSTLGDDAIRYEPTGGYELFTSADEHDEAAQHIPAFNGWVEELISEKQVYKSSTLNGYPIIFNRLEGMLHPGKMMQRLLGLTAQEGVEVQWKCPVSELADDGSVVLEGGIELRSKQVLVACNGFTSRLLPGIGIRPARGFVMVTNEQEILPWRGTFHHDRGYIYFRNLDNRLLIGGARNLAAQEEETDRFGVNPVIKNHLCTFASEVLRLSPEWKIDYEWSGIMGFTDTKTPVLKRLDSTRVVAAGLSGMGVAIGMQIGKEAAALLNNE